MDPKVERSIVMPCLNEAETLGTCIRKARAGLAAAGVAGYPRQDESLRYWLRANLGRGQSPALCDGSGNDESDGWSALPKMSAEMNPRDNGDIFDRIHISFHSNAGGRRRLFGGLLTPGELPLLC